MCILVVANIVATTLPLMSLVLVILFVRVDEWLHPNIVATVILLQIIDIEANSVALSNISY